MTDVIKKALASPVGADPLAYVMSDETVDRMGDVIEARGWTLGNFAKNPIALFNHDSKFIVGHWTDVKVEAGRLIGKLNLLPAGISERLDEIRAAVEAGVLRAVSVGFHAIDAEPMGKGGVRFKKAELVECSLVSIPANPNALALAKSLNLSDDAQQVIFGKSADEIAALRRSGEPAVKNLASASKPQPFTRKKKMATLAERIESAQEELVALKDQLTEHVKSDDVDAIVTEELSGKIEAKETELAAFKRAEGALAAKTAEPVVNGKAVELRRPAALPMAAKKNPADYLISAAVVQVLAHCHKESTDQIVQRAYGGDETVKTLLDHQMHLKAATAPATTTTSGWASQLVQTVNADFMETLTADSVYPELSSRGLRLTFGRNGAIAIPSRSSTPTIAGSFVAEGAPIPVRQGAFTSQSLTPKKMAVISTFTREIAQHSVPAIEGLIRDAIREDTSVALDTVLLDATAASSIRPAGIRNGVSVTTATSGGGIDALVADAKGLVGALITATNGNVRSPVWIMNPAQALSISLTGNAGGDFVFADAMNQGNFLGYPVIQSPTVTAGMLILVDAADFVSVTGDEPMFDVSDQATLHMEDTTPLAIGTAGSPNTVAAPVRSLWQTDSIGLRMILPMNWTLRRSGVLAWTQSVTW